MPIQNGDINFKFGSEEKCIAESTKDKNSICFSTDTHKIFIGGENYSSDTDMNAVTKNYIDEQINNTQNQIEEQTTITNARIDNIIAHNNDTEGNTELIDIRTGADGTVYASAGNAVRNQIGALNTKCNDIKDTIDSFYSVNETIGNNLFNSAAAEKDKTLNHQGVPAAANGYTLSDYISVADLEKVYFSYNSLPDVPTYVFTFDDQKNFIERIPSSNLGDEFAISENVAYIRFNTTNGRVPIFMVASEGNLPYESYYCVKETTLTADNIVLPKLFGKKLCVCGDSLTYGAYADTDESGDRKTYAYYTAQRNHMTLTVNAVSGSTLTSFKEGETGGGAAFTYGGQYARYKRLGDDLDYITIWFGLNDNTYLSKTNGIGTIDSTDVTTFYGAWNTVLQYLINKYPTAKIGIIVTYGASQEIRDATRNICKKYGIPPLDFMGDDRVPIISGFGRDNGTIIDSSVLAKRRETFIYSGDSVHMIDAGYRYFSTVFENYLESL